PFVGECSWGFKLSIATRIFQKARAICWLGQKHASVVPGARSGARGWLRAGPSSILAKPSTLCFGQVFRNALMGSSRAGAGTGIESSILELSSGIWPGPGLVPGSIFGCQLLLARLSSFCFSHIFWNVSRGPGFGV
ncbi:hypothetical protein LINPERHAP2_LOCUS20842, partial [Linum perenne]